MSPLDNRFLIRGVGSLAVVFISLPVAVAAPAADGAAASPPSLFAEVPAAAVPIFPPQEQPGVVRSRRVAVRDDLLLKAPEVLLDLFPDTVLAARRSRTEVRSLHDYSWFGTVEGGGQAIFTVRGGNVAGAIRTPDAVYRVRYEAPGVHSVDLVDEAALGDCAGAVPPPEGTLAAGSWTPEGPGRPEGPAAANADDGSTIDVMVVYTSNAHAADPNIEGDIRLSVDQTNQAYENSGISQRLRLTYLGQVDYIESGNSDTDLDRLATIGDGYLEPVHGLRDDNCADLVALWTGSASPNVCGIGYLMPNPSPFFNTRAFSVVRASCGTSLTPAHEFGHNMGAAHDRANAGGPGVYTYSYGYQHPLGKFHTVMAYQNGCPGVCPRIPNFSNPDVLYFGDPTGVPETEANSANNALTLNQTALVVSRFRDSSLCSFCSPDAQEDDDLCEQSSLMDGSEVRTLNHCQDSTDWIEFGAVEGTVYTFETSNLGSNGDTVLRLFDTDCSTLLNINNDGGVGRASRLVWQAPADGCYHVQVTELQDAFGNDREYDLSIQGATDPTLCSAGGAPEAPDPIRVLRGQRGTVAWDSVAGATTYDVYRGTKDTSPFGTYDHVCFQSDLPTPSVDDPEVPGPGRWFYYLVSSRSGSQESSLGTDSSGNERPNDSPCP